MTLIVVLKVFNTNNLNMNMVIDKMIEILQLPRISLATRCTIRENLISPIYYIIRWSIPQLAGDARRVNDFLK